MSSYESRLAAALDVLPRCLCVPTDWGCWLTPVLQWHVPAFRIGVNFDGTIRL
jgi:hypothetical protein